MEKICLEQHLCNRVIKNSVGLKIFTGDPNLDPGGITVDGEYYPGGSPGGGPNGSYKGYHANEYRLGVLYVGYKGYQVGRNSEKIRKFFQNTMTHDKIGVPRFPDLSYKFPPSSYFQYQSYNKYTLW